MNALTITYIISSSSIDCAEFPGNSLEALKTEIEESIRAAFPIASYVDVVLDNVERTKIRVDGLVDDDFGEQAEAIEAECARIGDEVWNHGQWHYAE